MMNELSNGSVLLNAEQVKSLLDVTKVEGSVAIVLLIRNEAGGAPTVFKAEMIATVLHDSDGVFPHILPLKMPEANMTEEEFGLVVLRDAPRFLEETKKEAAVRYTDETGCVAIMVVFAAPTDPDWIYELMDSATSVQKTFGYPVMLCAVRNPPGYDGATTFVAEGLWVGEVEVQHV